MFQRPRLKTFLTVFPISETTWGIRGGTDELWRITFRDAHAFEVLGALLPMLNGASPREAIFASMEAKGISRAEVEQLLQSLTASSLLEDAATIHLPPDERERHASAIAFFSRYTSEGGDAYQARLRESRLGLFGDGDLGECLEHQLLEAGVGGVARLHDREAIWTGGSQDRPQLFVVAQDADDPDLLAAMDAYSKRADLPWLLVQAIESHIGSVGPLFIPRDTACYLSLEARRRGTLPYFSEHEAFRRHLRGNVRPSPCGGLRAFAELLASVAIIEITKYLSAFSPPALAGRFITVNFMTWELESHDVLRVPHVGLEPAQPETFAWKEMPSDALKGHGFDDFLARRS